MAKASQISRVVLKQGSQGVAVGNLQKNLKQLGIAITIDEDFGVQTAAAVRAFQLAHNLLVDGEVGPDTQAMITKAIVAQIPGAPTFGPIPYLEWLRSHIGEMEVTGETPTAFDEEVFAHTNYGSLDGVMEPGCAATLSTALDETGYASPHTALAEDFRKYGAAADALAPGVICGMNWEGKKDHADHVTVLDHVIDEKTGAFLGGNQSHEVKISVFSLSAICFMRQAVKA